MTSSNNKNKYDKIRDDMLAEKGISCTREINVAFALGAKMAVNEWVDITNDILKAARITKDYKGAIDTLETLSQMKNKILG